MAGSPVTEERAPNKASVAEEKAAGEARVLTVEEIVRRQEQKDTAEAEATAKKQRAAALKGKGVFAKLVWKEMATDFTVFE